MGAKAKPPVYTSSFLGKGWVEVNGLPLSWTDNKITTVFILSPCLYRKLFEWFRSASWECNLCMRSEMKPGFLR